eukprot:3981555-Amphidinium_carterae.2
MLSQTRPLGYGLMRFAAEVGAFAGIHEYSSQLHFKRSLALSEFQSSTLSLQHALKFKHVSDGLHYIRTILLRHQFHPRFALQTTARA